jgi:hypothetical protein
MTKGINLLKPLQNFNYKHTAVSENVKRYRKEKKRKRSQFGLGSFSSSEAKTLLPQ